ncbi:MAG: heme ABC transporter ATP-binding protein [Pseudomonadota bacterium]
MLEARGLTLRIGAATILHDVMVAASPGRLLAILGPNGAGKSSLLACLSGAAAPSQGEALLDGAPVSGTPPSELALRRAFLEQSPELRAPFTVSALARLAIPRALSPSEADEIAEAAIRQVGLGELADRVTTTLSGGERHRAHLARVLAQLKAGRRLGHPGWLLLDEPTASLDLAHQTTVMAAAAEAAAEGAGVIAVLHDLSLAAAWADDVVLMKRGEVVAAGLPETLLTAETLSALYDAPIGVGRIDGALVVAPLHRREEGGAPSTVGLDEDRRRSA